MVCQPSAAAARYSSVNGALMRDMIAYMNARRAAKPASGGAKQDYSVQYAPDSELDPIEQTAAIAETLCADMHIAVEAMRYRLFAQFGIPVTEPEADIPF